MVNMKKWIITIGIIVLICSGVVGVTVKINVNNFEEVKNKVITWKDEVVVPLIERGFSIDI